MWNNMSASRPGANQWVLLYDTHGRITFGRMATFSPDPIFFECVTRESSLIVQALRYVTHWMPLPAPPVAGSTPATVTPEA